MKIDELIEELEAVKQEHGNLEVISHPAFETNIRIEEYDGQKKVELNSY